MEASDVAPADVRTADAVEATATDAAAGPTAEAAAMTEGAPAVDADATGGDGEAPTGVPANVPAKTPKPKPKPKPAPESTPGSEVGTGGRVRRERKQTEFLRPAEAPKKDVEEVLAVGAGSGSRLRDIPNVSFKLGKVTGKDELVEGLHNLLFRRKGVANARKKAVLDFAGFAFAEDQKEKEVEARRASLGKWKLDLLHRLMDALDLPRGSADKAAKVERVLEFLQEPRALSDVDLAAKEAAKKAKEKAKRERAAAKKDKEASKKEKGAKRKSAGGTGRATKKAKKEEEGEEEEGGESEAEEEGEGGDDGEESEEEKLPAKKDRRSSAGRARQPAAADEAAAEPMDEDEAEEQADPAGEVPAAKLKASVEAILKGFPEEELPSITPKPILRKLEAEYGFSLKSRKAEVITIAQAYVQAYMDAHPAAAAEPVEEAADAEAKPAAEAPKAEAGPAEEAAAPAEEAVATAEEAAAAGLEGGGPSMGDGA